MATIHRFNIFILFLCLVGCRSSTNEYTKEFEEIWQQVPYKVYTDSIAQFPKNDALYFARGEQLFTHQQLRASLYDYKQAYILKPSSIYLQAIAINFKQLQQLDSTIVYLNKGMQQFPNDSSFYFQLIDAYRKNHEDSLALGMVQLLIKKDSNNVRYVQQAATLYVALKDTLKAIQLLEKSYSAYTQINNATFQLASLYAETKNKKALQLSDHILATDSTQYKALPYYIKGIYFTNTNKPEQAIDMFDKSIVHDWTFVDAYTDKGVLLFKQKKYMAAQRVFELSLTVSNTYPDAYYWIGRCQEAIGKGLEAAENYRKAIGLDKNFEEARQALTRVSFHNH